MFFLNYECEILVFNLKVSMTLNLSVHYPFKRKNIHNLIFIKKNVLKKNIFEMIVLLKKLC